LSGVSRLQYATYTKFIRMMCSGRVDMEFVFRALSNGMDGVFIGGCHLNDCHYSTHGNYHAVNMVLLTKKIIAHLGLNPERLRIEMVSAGEGLRFAEVVHGFGMQVKGIGPLGKGEGINSNALKLKLKAIAQLIPYIRVVQNEKLRVHFATVEEYRDFYSSEEFDRLFGELIANKFAVSQIMLLLRERPLSAGEIAKNLNLAPSEVTQHLNSSVMQGLVRYEGSQECFALVLNG